MDTAPNETSQTPESPESTGSPGTEGTGTEGTGSATTTTTSQPPPSQAVGHGHSHEMRLHRRRCGRMLGGVAAGLADFFDVDPVLIRVGFVVLTFVGGLAVPLYLAGWALIPDEDSDTSIAEEILAHERTRGAY
jgi:phage shock protein PspC (stress-responsive transcriptional regulator)